MMRPPSRPAASSSDPDPLPPRLIEVCGTNLDAFVSAAAPLITAVVRRALASYRLSEEDVMDAAQDVFVRLCANEYRLLKTYDPARAGLSTCGRPCST